MPRLPVTDCLIDACALLAYFRREEGRDVVKDLLDRTERGEIRLFMNVINQVEVFYDCIRKVGLDRVHALVRRAIAGADEGQDGEEPPQPRGGEDSVSHKKLFP